MTSLVQLLFVVMSSLHAQATQAPVERVLVKDNRGHQIYIVNERAPSLSAIARELYGNRRMADKIADWNGLPHEAWLKLGDRLKIERAPTYSAAEGTALLIRYWHIAGKHDLVARLKGLGGGDQPQDEPKMFAKDWSLKGAPPITGAWLPGYPLKVRVPTPPVQEAEQQLGGPAPTPAFTAPSPQGAPSPAGPSGSADTNKSATAPAVAGEANTESKRDPSSDPQESDEKKRELKSDSYWLGNNAAELIEALGLKLKPSRAPQETQH